jgi:type VI secretion system protein ImpB
MSSNGQKFIGRNRPPRVQIEYDLELYGAQKKVELPMVVGVMADLYGAQETPPPKVEDRKFLEIDHDNFDGRMAAMKPRIATSVPNRMTGEGTLPVTLTFKKLEDFSPTAVANNVEPLRRLLEARKRLSDLVTYMDGRGDAEQLIADSLKDPQKLLALVAGMKGDTNGASTPSDLAAGDTGATEE